MTQVLKKRMTRRNLLRVGGCAGITAAACGVSAVVLDSQTDFFDRLQGISDTPLLGDASAWTYADGTLTLALNSIPDLAEPGSAIRLEDEQVPERLLIVHGVDENYYVYLNECTHAGRRIDPSGDKLECTSFNRSKFDYAGEVLSGPADSALTTYAVAVEGDQLVIALA